MVREANREDLTEILELYLHLHETSVPEPSRELEEMWQRIMEDGDYHLIVKTVDGKIVSSCVCVIVPNLTHQVRPYAIVENVVTHSDYRRRGYASECLDYARAAAEEKNCYKIMLLTGSKNPDILGFYRRAGYNSTDKTAFIQWLDA